MRCGRPAGPRRAHVLRGALAALLAAGGVSGAAAQVPADTLAGRVIARDSTPIAAARVSAVSDDGRVVRARTGADGRYLLAFPGGGGRYALTVQALGFTPLSTVVEREPGTRRIVRDVRLNVRAVALDTLRVGTRPPATGVRTATPGETLEAFSSLTAEIFPREPGDLEGLASLAPGVVRLGSSEDGPALSIAGQPPGQNRTTLDGASYGGTRLPAEGLRSVATLTSVYDVSRGGFSGGEIAARTISGTNRWGGALTLRLDDPALRDGAFRDEAFGARDRRVFASGGGGGALLRDRLFVYGAGEFTRAEGPRPFLDVGDDAALRALGVAPDSARRFAGLVGAVGGATGRAEGPDGVRESGSALARVDYVLSPSHSLAARLDWRTSRLSGFGATPFRLPSATDEQRTRDAGALLQLTSEWDAGTNELRVYGSAGEQETESESSLPAGRVRVSSLVGGDLMTATLGFGATSSPGAGSDRSLWEAADELTLSTADGGHLVKAGVLLQEERLAVSAGPNHLGTFTFNSLSDLEGGRPAAFTRTLGETPYEVVRRHAAAYVGDTWTPARGLAVTYGLRLEASRFQERPELAPALDSLVAGAPRGVPSEAFLSPRIGFSYALPGRGGVKVRGGAGLFGGKVVLRSLASAWNETGTAGAGTRLVCIGANAPTPDWHAYAADPGAIPTACAEGAAGSVEGAAPATLFDPGYGAPRTWRLSLGVDGSVTRRISYQAGALLVRGVRLPTAVDRNLDAIPRFLLAGEGGRPVYADPADIEPTSGLVAPAASRLRPGLGIVREVDARGESRVAQLTSGVTGIVGKNTLVALSYTFSRARDRAGPVAAPGGASASAGADPLAREWGPADLDRRHAFQVILTDRLSANLQVSAIGQLGSGLPFTPLVAGDVNGDGSFNDRAFVFAPPASPDTADAMAGLLRDAPEPVRDCLRRQLGRIAGRNSCRTPWWSSLDLMAEYTPSRFTDSRRLVLTLTASNVTAGLDYLLHGADGLRGWGQLPLPDPYLLEVRGFDPAARSYRYEVNRRFGQPIGGGSLRVPFRLTLQARVTVGADPRHQPMAQLVAMAVSAGPGQLRGKLAERIRNVPATVLALDAADPGELALTPDQVRGLRSLADALEPRVRAAVDGLAAAFGRRGPSTAGGRAALAEQAREAYAVVQDGLRATREILRPDQWEKLPAWLVRPPSADELERPPPVEVRTGGE